MIERVERVRGREREEREGGRERRERGGGGKRDMIERERGTN